jgi:hypothetical protein
MGMKSGSGEDPFADAEADSEDPEDERPVNDDNLSSDQETDSSGSQLSGMNSSQHHSLPWKYARENVKDGRNMVQFYLQADTKTLESQALADLEDEFDESVLTFDLREAAYRVTLQNHLDEVAEKLREWGYDIE